MDHLNFTLPSGLRFCDGTGSIVHKVPRVNICIDGENTDPETVREYVGKPLHSTLDSSVSKNPILHMFTDPAKARDLARVAKADSASKNRRSYAVAAADGYMRLYQHVNFQGCTWHLSERESLIVTDYRTLLTCGFLWWGWKPANNEISSIELNFSRRITVFYEDVNLQGSSYIAVGPTNIANLSDLGWNDRISSHEVLE